MFFYTRYRRELGAACRRVQSSGSSITEARLGAIEQVTFGEGPPVLLAHGVVGGADQGRGLVGAYFGDGFKVVAVSRFGYGRSPLPTEDSSQVDICYSGADKQSARKSHGSYASTHEPHRLQGWRQAPNELN